MKIRQKITACFGMLLLLMFSGSVLGQIIQEQGPGLDDSNSLLALAQPVDSSSDSIVVAGELFFHFHFVLNPPAGMEVYRRDVDFYSFYAPAGSHLVVDIDNGIGGASSVDTKIGLFGPGPAYEKLAESDDADSIDDGSQSLKDSRIDEFVVPASGIYTVAVTGSGAMFLDGGAVMGGATGAMGNGDYLLTISGLSSGSTQIEVAIAIATHGKFKKSRKHKKQKVARIDLKKKKKVKVAIFGSEAFPVSDIDASTLTFGAVGDEKTLRKCKHSTKDVNRDGEPDLVCEFSLRKSGFSKHSREGVLNGQTLGGQSFSGVDDITVKGKAKKKG
jgi:hypothetical protein